MRPLRFVALLLSVSLLPFALSGCSSSTVKATSPNNPSNPTDPGNPGGSSSAAAYVYVANRTATGGPDQVVAYSADANGQLTAVPGSPFNDDVDSMAANGAYLMASDDTTPNIDTYTIGSNGAITLATQFNYGQQTGYKSTPDTTCGGVGGLLFDRTGKSLYGEVFNISCSSNNAVASFAFDSSNGSVSYLGNENIGYNSSGAIAFLGNDDYAYSAFPGMYWTVLSFSRISNGNLVSNSSFTTVRPIAPPPGSTSGLVIGYTPGLTATDTTNHVAIAEFPDFTMAGSTTTPPVQLAAYTADSNGILTTGDTYATMPYTTIDPLDLEMSPSGTLLAVAGTGGVQIFHFNGANSITNFTSVLTSESIAQVAWDNSNHLYAITLTGAAYGSNSTTPGKLHVFTVTASGATEAPGSPYTVTTPVDLAVLSGPSQ